jgi:hypothetical protein
LLKDSRDVIHAVFRRGDPAAPRNIGSNVETISAPEINGDTSMVEFARCFLRLANLPNFPLDRLSRYEAMLWRQARSHSFRA